MKLMIRVVTSWAVVFGVASISRADNVVTTTVGVYTETQETEYDAIAGSLLKNGTGPFGGQCASTSLINSFSYLEAAYPNVYPNSPLTTEDGTVTPTQARNDLDNGQNGITNVRLQGDVWNAKLNWVSLYAPGTTAFSGITNTSAGSAQGMGYMADRSAVTFGASGADMWTWLMGQINAGEDVELGLFDHMTTVMGYATDTNGKDYLEIIDPNSPTGNAATVGPGADGNGTVGEWVTANTNANMLLTLGGFTAGQYRNPNIYYMFAESPVPEPGMFVSLIGLGAMGLIHVGRRRRNFTSCASIREAI